MKLISLNTWGGKLFVPLLEFIQAYSKDTDIFCFQEVFNTESNLVKSAGFRLNLYKEFLKILPDYQGYFASSVENYISGSFQPHFVNFNLSWGLAIFIKKNLKVNSYDDFFVYGKSGSFNPKDQNSIPRNIQYVNFTKGGKDYTVCNLHGIWVRGPKIDTPSRIKQSEIVKEFLGKQGGGKILVGDFNLDINTKSLKILEQDLKNLIREFRIERTRSRMSPFFGKDNFQKFADYVFVSPDVKVINFKVPDIKVSDHLPMILEFS